MRSPTPKTTELPQAKGLAPERALGIPRRQDNSETNQSACPSTTQDGLPPETPPRLPTTASLRACVSRQDKGEIMAFPTTQYWAPLHHNTPTRHPAQEAPPQPLHWAHNTSDQTTTNTTQRQQDGYTSSNTTESPWPGHAEELILCHPRGQKSAAMTNDPATWAPAPTSPSSLSTWQETPSPKWYLTPQTPS